MTRCLLKGIGVISIKNVDSMMGRAKGEDPDSSQELIRSHLKRRLNGKCIRSIGKISDNRTLLLNVLQMLIS